MMGQNFTGGYTAFRGRKAHSLEWLKIFMAHANKGGGSQ
jgi:hypothetical protein